MATESQIRRLRADIGDDNLALSDVAASDIYEEAAEVYPDTPLAQHAYTRVIAIRRLMANAAMLTSYRQNATSENLGDIVSNLDKLLKYWLSDLETAVINSGRGVARFGSTKNKPARLKEVPDSDYRL